MPRQLGKLYKRRFSLLLLACFHNSIPFPPTIFSLITKNDARFLIHFCCYSFRMGQGQASGGSSSHQEHVSFESAWIWSSHSIFLGVVVLIRLSTRLSIVFFCSEIAKHLSLPPVKLHCSMLAEDAIKAAVKDYEAKKGKKMAKAEEQDTPCP